VSARAATTDEDVREGERQGRPSCSVPFDRFQFSLLDLVMSFKTVRECVRIGSRQGQFKGAMTTTNVATFALCTLSI